MIKKYIMSTVSLFVALYNIGLRTYYNAQLSNEYFNYAKYLFKGTVLNYKKECSFIMDKAFMSFCESVILKVHSNLQQPAPLGPQPVHSSTITNNPADYYQSVQNLNCSLISHSVTQAPTPVFMQASMQASPYHSIQHSHMQNLPSQSPSLKSSSVKSSPAQIMGSSDLNVNAFNQASKNSAFSVMNLEVSSKTNEVMDYNTVINALNVAGKNFPKVSGVANAKELIKSFIYYFNTEYQKSVPGSIQWLPFDSQRQGKKHQKVAVKFEGIKTVLIINFKVAPSKDSPNSSQPNPAPVRHVSSETSKQPQVQSSSTSFQEGPSTKPSGNQQPIPRQPKQLSNGSESVTDVPLPHMINELSSKDLIKEGERLDKQAAQLNSQLKTNLDPSALVKADKLSSNTMPLSTEPSSVLSSVPDTAPVSTTNQKIAGGFAVLQIGRFIEEARKRLANYIPLRVSFRKLTAEHGLNLSDVENKMIRFHSLPIIIAESVVNCIVKLEPAPEEFNILQKTVLKTSKEVVSILTREQLEQYIRKEKNMGILIRQLNLLPKGNTVHLTLMGSIPGKADKYSEKEINLISCIWPLTANLMDRLVNFRYSSFEYSKNAATNSFDQLDNTNAISGKILSKIFFANSNSKFSSSTESIDSKIIKKGPMSPISVNSVEQKISKTLKKNQVNEIPVHDKVSETSVLPTENRQLDQKTATENAKKSVNFHSTNQERDTESAVGSVAPKKTVGVSENPATAALDISPLINSPAFVSLNATQPAASDDSMHSTKVDPSQVSTTSGIGASPGNSKCSPNPTSGQPSSSASTGEAVASDSEPAKEDISKSHFIDTLLLLDIPEIDENAFENPVNLFENNDNDSESDIEEITMIPKIKAFKKLAGKDIAKPGSVSKN
jgi:hypothetical protein